MTPIARFPLCVLLILVTTTAGGAHITDKLVVGVYGEPLAEGTPLRLIASGTPLEVLERRAAFSQVRLNDDVKGWVESRYITDEKPAKAMLLETQARLRQMGMELAGLRERIGDDGGAAAANPATPPSAREAQLRQSLDQARERIDELERQLAAAPRDAAALAELEDLQARSGEALELLADAHGLVLSDERSGERGFVVRHRGWLIGIGALLIGFGAGVTFIDYRIRRRYGGFRI